MDLQTIKTLIDFVGRSRLSELTVSQDGATVRIWNGAGTVPEAGSGAHPAVHVAGKTLASHSALVTDEPSGHIITAPMSGTLHRAPKPAAPPFVEAGDVVEAGQNLCVIESMKVFNMVSAPHAGRVTQIFVEDGQEVEAGQHLAEIC